MRHRVKVKGGIVGRLLEDVNYIVPRWSLYNPNFYYATGVDIDHTILVVNEGNPELYTVKMHKEFLEKKFPKWEVKAIQSLKEFRKRFRGYYVEESWLTHKEYMGITGNRMKPIGERLLELREVKDRKEIKILKMLRKDTLRMIRGVSENVKGKRENSVKEEVYKWIYSKGYREGFEPIVANSKNARFPHYTGGRGLIKDYLLMDVGIKREGYTSDITRCEGDLGKFERIYENLQGAVKEIAKEAYAGREIREFIKEVERILKYWEIPELPHSIGHGVGLEVHELPRLAKSNKKELKENSVICIEPGYYKEVGLRYEDMFVVGKKGARVL